MKSLTKTGTEVTLTGVETDLGHPAVRVEFSHPKHGLLSFTSSEFGKVSAGEGIIGRVAGQRCCIQVPRADFDTVMSEARGIIAKEIEHIKAGQKLIELFWCEGSPLSGYMARCSHARDLLVELELAHDVTGWGTRVEDSVAVALGTTFTYAQALELARPEMEKKQARENKKTADREAKFTEARRTGEPVPLARWNDWCEENGEEDMVIVTQYAMPDGTTKTERVHTH